MTQQSPVLQHPGEILLDQFLLPHYRSVGKAAQALDLPISQLIGIISGEDRVTETLALRFAQHFGPAVCFWVRLQNYWDHRTA